MTGMRPECGDCRLTTGVVWVQVRAYDAVDVQTHVVTVVADGGVTAVIRI